MRNRVGVTINGGGVAMNGVKFEFGVYLMADLASGKFEMCPDVLKTTELIANLI
jgi:hypothetical protein